MKRPLTDETATEIAARFRTLGDPLRLRLLEALRGGPRSVGELATMVGGNTANVSKHLQLMLHQRFVDRTKSGVTVHYRIVDPQVFRLCELVCDDLVRSLQARSRSLASR